MRKRDFSAWRVSLSREAIRLLEDAQQRELPKNKNRRRRNGNGLPLSAFMASPVDDGASKIMRVVNGFSSYPYSSYCTSSEVLADRIAKKHPMTAAQYYLLTVYIIGHYRGKGPSSVANMYLDDWVIDANLPASIHQAAFDWLRSLNRGVAYNLPLRFLISGRVTDLILQFQLCEALNTRNAKWTHLNS